MVVALFATFAGCAWAIWIVSVDGVVADQSEVIPIQIIFAVCFISYAISLLACTSRAICVLILSSDSVTLLVPFHKKLRLSYKYYPYIFHGYYFHGNISGLG